MDIQEEYNLMMDQRNTNRQSRKLIVVAILAFILGFFSAWLWLNDGTSPEVVTDEETVEVIDNGTVVVVGENSLNVVDQAPGRTVAVETVTLEKTGWVVVREDNQGQIGNILGARLFSKGESSGEVELLRGTVEGGTYYAALYNEDSDLEQNREFNLNKDLPLVDSEGSSIQVQFKTTSSPE